MALRILLKFIQLEKVFNFIPAVWFYQSKICLFLNMSANKRHIYTIKKKKTG